MQCTCPIYLYFPRCQKSTFCTEFQKSLFLDFFLKKPAGCFHDVLERPFFGLEINCLNEVNPFADPLWSASTGLAVCSSCLRNRCLTVWPRKDGGEGRQFSSRFTFESVCEHQPYTSIHILQETSYSLGGTYFPLNQRLLERNKWANEAHFRQLLSNTIQKEVQGLTPPSFHRHLLFFWKQQLVVDLLVTVGVLLFNSYPIGITSWKKWDKNSIEATPLAAAKLQPECLFDQQVDWKKHKN